MSALARWCFTHRHLVLALWVALLVGLSAATGARGTEYYDDYSLPGTDSTKVLDLLESNRSDQVGDIGQIVFHRQDGPVTDEAVARRIEPMLAEVARVPSVTVVDSPLTAAGASQVSSDRTIAFATVHFATLAQDIPAEDAQQVLRAAQALDGDGLQVEIGGVALEGALEPASGGSEIFGILVAGIVLYLAFGSLVGSLVPIVVALFGVGAGILTIGQLSSVLSLGTTSPTLGLLIGLGVGIDYALFIVTRFRKNLMGGLPPEAAAVQAMTTSGRAVLFAGGTVVVSLLGLLVLRLTYMTGLGVSSAVTVLTTVLAAVTLLPALLGYFGARLLSRRERRLLATESGPVVATTDGWWTRWARLVERRRLVLGLVALAVLAVLSGPALTMRLGVADAGNDPADSTTRQAYDLIAQGFGAGSNGPLLLVGEFADQDPAADARAFAALAETLPRVPGVGAVSSTPPEDGARIGVIQVVPDTAPQDEETSDLIRHLREQVVPAAESGTSLRVWVGGPTAIFDDFTAVLIDKMPLFVGVILGLGALLLLIAFRSVLVPLTAVVVNLLAAVASFGVLAAVFHRGWGSELIGAGPGGPVESYLPVIMLAILFGLSMDYQVFLVSRMYEEWRHSGDNRNAVRVGLAETGRVVTAAALIMIFVFGGFILEGERTIAEFGVGLAAAVAIDAFLIRTVLVPVVMYTLGRANWWLPGPVDRFLPRWSVEGDPEEPETRLREAEMASRS